LKIIPLSDFDENTCTRIRRADLPSAGLRVIGTDWQRASETGASLGRNIIQWYQAYDEQGNLNFDNLDSTMRGYHDAGMKVILTLRANHPDKSENGFNIGDRTLFVDDSWPKYEYEADWTDYLKNVTDRYYLNPLPEYEDTLAAIQIGNEWGHQFIINESYGRYQVGQEQKAILDLMNFSYKAVKGIAPDLSVFAFAISGTPGWALGDGQYDSGDEWTYDGIYYAQKDNKNGISVILPGDVNQGTIAGIKRIIAEGNASYDYFDAHIYFQRPEEARYVANFVRNVWMENEITGKGLVSTEFANPIYNYSYDWHSHSLKAAQAVAYHAGFDTIILGNWYPSPGSPNLLQDSLRSDAGYQFSQVYNYTEFQGITKDFVGVRRQNNLFTFDSQKSYDLNKDVPPYPSYYQCSDGLDNDNDGFADELDSDCEDYYDLSINCNNQKVQNLPGCIDPEGFSEDNWIFLF